MNKDERTEALKTSLRVDWARKRFEIWKIVFENYLDSNKHAYFSATWRSGFIAASKAANDAMNFFDVEALIDKVPEQHDFRYQTCHKCGAKEEMKTRETWCPGWIK